ncbi:MAG: hypothetical protein Q4C47_05390, partial [Planctomycetia bacterium]|nr:hypothetical protein [Planctomycetia bacterium]
REPEVVPENGKEPGAWGCSEVGKDTGRRASGELGGHREPELLKTGQGDWRVDVFPLQWGRASWMRRLRQ